MERSLFLIARARRGTFPTYTPLTRSLGDSAVVALSRTAVWPEMINSTPVACKTSSGALRSGVRLLATRWEARVSACSLEAATSVRSHPRRHYCTGDHRGGLAGHRRRRAVRRARVHGVTFQHPSWTCGLAFQGSQGCVRCRLSGGVARDAHGARHLIRRRHAPDLPQQKLRLGRSREPPPRHADHRRRGQRLALC